MCNIVCEIWFQFRRYDVAEFGNEQLLFSKSIISISPLGYKNHVEWVLIRNAFYMDLGKRKNEHI